MAKKGWCIFLNETFFFNQRVVPDKSRSSYMGFAPPSACLLTAADSLLSLLPITAVDGGRSDHRRRQRFCHNCVTNWKKGQRPQVAGGTSSMQQRLQRLCLGMMARFMSVIEQTNGRRTNGRNGGNNERTDGTRQSTTDDSTVGRRLVGIMMGFLCWLGWWRLWSVFFSKWQEKCN
jgi:hypothetical protein